MLIIIAHKSIFNITEYVHAPISKHSCRRSTAAYVLNCLDLDFIVNAFSQFWEVKVKVKLFAFDYLYKCFIFLVSSEVISHRSKFQSKK
jgi:hypothetical protein